MHRQYLPYIPMDRRHAMAAGASLPDVQVGAALFADISGFTALTEALVRALGPQRGADALPRQLNLIYDVLVAEVTRFRGSVIAFSGDAVTCWFDDEAEAGGAEAGAARAVACALAMQAQMRQFAEIRLAGVGAVQIAIKVGVAAGRVRRFLVGDPAIQLLDVLAGATLDRLAAAEHQAARGEVLVDEAAAAAVGERLVLAAWRADGEGQRFAVVAGLAEPIAPRPWPELAAERFSEEQLRGWLLPPVYARLRRGLGEFLTELRPATALFLSFGTIDYDGDPRAHARLDAFIRHAQQVVGRYDGYLLQLTVGDKGSFVYAAFGAPVAHEDDARRAVLSALELRQPFDDVVSQIKIGVSQGRMRTGAYGSSDRRTYGILGDETNLAARLMQRAQPGQVLISPPVFRAVASSFRCEALPAITVKGKSEPLTIYEVAGALQSHGAHQAAVYSLPMVGRAAELELLGQKLDAALAGRGQVVGITADAGMGKSRLVAELLGLATSRGAACLGGECQSYGTSSAYLVWRPIWQELLGVAGEQTAAERIRQLEATLTAMSPELAAQAPLLGALLDLPIPENEITRPIPAIVRKQIVEGLLSQILRGRAAAQPLCIVLEDCHWIDSLSFDLLGATAAAIGDVPVLLVLVFRLIDHDAHTRLAPSQLANYSEIRLEDLGLGDSTSLIALKMRQLFQLDADPPPALVRQLTEHGQGNPFYIEELMNYLRDRGVNPAALGSLSSLELPNSLYSLMLSRIDRLTENQQLTVKVASIIGRRFAVDWLWGVHPALGETSSVRHDLQVIQDVDLALLENPDPELVYLFRHVVTREVAYESLSSEVRERLHEQLADFLERIFGDAPPLDLLAYHYAHSANRAKEAHYCALAGDLAVRNGAYADAHSYVLRALEIVAATPDSTERVKQEVALQLSLGAILLVIRGQGSSQAKAAYDRARELCAQLPPGPELSRAIFGLWTYYLFQGLMVPAGELAADALGLAQMAGDPGILIMAHLVNSQTHLWSGLWNECVHHMEKVFAYYNPADHQMFITHYAQNPRFTATASGFWALWALGYPERSLATVHEAVAEARALDHDFTYVIAYQCLPMLYYLERRDDMLAETVGEFVLRAQRSGNPFYAALATALEAWAGLALDRPGDHLGTMLGQRATMQALGSKLVEPFMVTLIADAYLRSGQYAEGLAVLDADYERFAANRQVSYMPAHLRIRGELLVATGAPDAEAEAAFLQALAVAREHQARSFELRAALSYSRLLERQGRGAEARAMLSAIYGWFSEGHDTPDLREAAERIAALS